MRTFTVNSGLPTPDESFDDVFSYVMRPFNGNETVSVELPLTMWQELYETLQAAQSQLYTRAYDDRQRDSYFSHYSQRDYERLVLMNKRLFMAIHLNVGDQISSEASSALLESVDYDDAYRSILDKCKQREENINSQAVPF